MEDIAVLTAEEFYDYVINHYADLGYQSFAGLIRSIDVKALCDAVNYDDVFLEGYNDHLMYENED